MGQGAIDKDVLDLTILIYSIIVILVIAVTIILFFIVFQRRKNKLLIDKVIQQQKFDEELVKTQQEIQEETLKHVGRELHDNVGQLLAVATMQLNAAKKVVNDTAKLKVESASEALKDSLAEVRALSKSLNSDVIFNLGFETTVQSELERLEKSGLISTELNVTGNKVNFENKKDEIILFRILQEFFSNTLKYADAEKLEVSIEYKEQELQVLVSDNGKGFDIDTVNKGSGLVNMQKRAELIKADLSLTSNNGKGTQLSIIYPFKSV